MAFVAGSDACLANIDRLDQETLPRLLKTDTALILNRRHAGNGFEVLVNEVGLIPT